MDFGKRAFDHSFRLDPIVRSLLDTDFYKLLMLQFIWKKYYHENVTFKLHNRTKSVRLAEVVSEEELRAQLDYVKNLSFTESELIWLRGQTFYGQHGLFEETFIDYLRTFKLPDYHLEKTDDGQFDLTFSGTWKQSTLWEIYALAIVNELRYRKLMSTMSESDLDIMYARAKVKLRQKLDVLNTLPNLNITDFGTRRRHSFLWQEYAVKTAKEVLGEKFTGTSNAYLAMKHNLEAKGTNAHELPMVIAALAKDDDELKYSQYEVLKQWQNVYRGGLLILLPDTFGTTQFLDGLPVMTGLSWTGARPDSKEPVEAGEELLKYWTKLDNKTAKDKLIIFSDGLDVQLPHQHSNGHDIVSLYNHFDGRVKIGFGFGTNLTNDFLGCPVQGDDFMKPISLVCKAHSANGRSCVKLSDNFQKATGSPEEIARYKRVFGDRGVKNGDIPKV